LGNNILKVSIICAGVSSFQRFFTVLASYSVGATKKKYEFFHISEIKSALSLTKETILSIFSGSNEMDFSCRIFVNSLTITSF